MHGMLSLLFLSVSQTVHIITFTYYMYALTKVDQYYILPSSHYTQKHLREYSHAIWQSRLPCDKPVHLESAS